MSNSNSARLTTVGVPSVSHSAPSPASASVNLEVKGEEACDLMQSALAPSSTDGTASHAPSLHALDSDAAGTPFMLVESDAIKDTSVELTEARKDLDSKEQEFIDRLEACALSGGWDDFGHSIALVNAATAEGYTLSHPIQRKAAFALAYPGQIDRDIFFSAPSGSGQAAVIALFVLDVAQKAKRDVLTSKRQDEQARLNYEAAQNNKTAETAPLLTERRTSNKITPFVVFMTPTTALGNQTAEKIQKLASRGLNVKVCAWVGGGSYPPEEGRGHFLPVDIVVGTPHRLVSMLQTGKLDFEHLDVFVHIEAKELFGPDLHDGHHGHKNKLIKHIINAPRTAYSHSPVRQVIVTPRMPVKLYRQVVQQILGSSEQTPIFEINWATSDDAALQEYVFVDITDPRHAVPFPNCADLGVDTMRKQALLGIVGNPTLLFQHDGVTVTVSAMVVCDTRKDVHSIHDLLNESTNQPNAAVKLLAQSSKGARKTDDHIVEESDAAIKMIINGEAIFLVTTPRAAIGLDVGIRPAIIAYQLSSTIFSSGLDQWKTLCGRGGRGKVITLLDPSAGSGDHELICALVADLRRRGLSVPAFMSECAAMYARDTPKLDERAYKVG